jgi:ABC-2 type transport system ATP-binding protein
MPDTPVTNDKHDIVTFDHVSYTVNTTEILHTINLAFKEETITGILGPNGAGKTTLLSLINGLHRPSAGTIIIFPGTSQQRNSIQQRIGVVFQETALYEELTTFENLRFAASLYTVANPKQRIAEVLEILQLTDRSQQVVSSLSGGLRRRIAIARALLHDPQLLIIDEPTVGVDVEARHAIWAHLNLLKSRGTTIIVATNYLDEALALCDTVAVLKKGTLLTIETPGALVARAGSCIDITCNEDATKRIMEAVAQKEGIIRTEKTPSGVSLFLTSATIPEKIMQLLLQTTHVDGFRVRAPDLAEVFNTIEKRI